MWGRDAVTHWFFLVLLGCEVVVGTPALGMPIPVSTSLRPMGFPQPGVPSTPTTT